ncbi:MAG: hypothetical protein MPW14_20105 [Candidatus Manganitrophus sp.]|nr:hypothetical protein [Candidatus Manganitrophus sp.]WDT73049.1 MAG: hypothetical protein MPW17_09475 [Candidatus Manganitrophus sp.]WDT74740.1 MAG: hypothetical protein MPW16_15930 [Candidatus Manganitrophus sp.]WDT79418.1 MAG: hypothetical protein MPW14_20105 [Candidatus Manganitrophus sp.]
MFNSLWKCKKGSALVEYALLIAGVALMGAAAVSTFGHKTTDMMAAVAAVLPGAHVDDNAPIVSGKLIETTDTVAGTTSAGAPVTGIGLDIGTIIANSATSRLGNNAATGGGSLGDLVLEP